MYFKIGRKAMADGTYLGVGLESLFALWTKIISGETTADADFGEEEIYDFHDANYVVFCLYYNHYKIFEQILSVRAIYFSKKH